MGQEYYGAAVRTVVCGGGGVGVCSEVVGALEFGVCVVWGSATGAEITTLGQKLPL